MRRLVWFAVPFALATAAVVYSQSVLLCLLLSLAAVIAFTIVFVRKRDLRRQAGIALAGLICGFLLCFCYWQLILQPIHSLSGTTVSIRATVNETPVKTRFGSRVDAEASVSGKKVQVLLYLNRECLTLQPGDSVSLMAELHRTDLDKNGDTRLYYQAKGIQLFGFARGEITIERSEKLPLRLLPAVFSAWLKTRLARLLPADCAGLSQALLTGDKYGMSYAQRSDMSMAGVSHTIAISGMHVSILLGFIMFLTRRRQLLTAVIGIPIIAFFVFSTGCSPSVIRAAVMQTFFLLAPLLRRENDVPTSLCAALLLILLQNPYAVSNVSVQLSFGAMAGMLLFTGRMYWKLTDRKWVDKLLHADCRKKKLPVRLMLKLSRALVHFVICSLTATLGALAFTVPLMAWHFGKLNTYTVLANLLIVWAIPVCFLGAILAVLASLAYLPLGEVCGMLLAVPSRYVLSTARWIARLPFASLSLSQPYLVIWLIAAYAVMALGLLGKQFVAPAIGVVGSFLLALTLTWLDARPQQFKITALDTGQGQCICMLTPDFCAVYDCGGSYGDEAGQHAAEYLLTAGVHRLDALILSHYDDDHIGGAAQLLYRIEVDRIYVPSAAEDDENRLWIRALAEQYNAALCELSERTVLPFDTGRLCILPPVSDVSDNAASLSILFTSGSYDLLATGDMDQSTEDLLLHTYLLPDVELLIAGHHGSKHSSGMLLLETVMPETVLISVGNNSYGHPSAEALRRFAQIGATVYRTDQNGDITIGR